MLQGPPQDAAVFVTCNFHAGRRPNGHNSKLVRGGGNMKMIKNAFQNLQNLRTRMIERRICRSKLAANQGAKVCFVTWDVHHSKMHGGSQLAPDGPWQCIATYFATQTADVLGTSWGCEAWKIHHPHDDAMCVIKHMAK